MNDVSNTALVTLKCHVQDAEKKDPVLADKSSLKAYEYLNANLDERGKLILNKNSKRNQVKHIAIRAKKYDEYAIQYLQKYPTATIVNIGCGLDHRFERVDNERCMFLDIDLPDIMDVKKEIFPATERYLQAGQSVFDFDWMNRIKPGPVLLLAEGVFMYCEEHAVRSLFQEIHKKVPDSSIVFEVFNSRWLTGLKGKMVDFKLRKQLKFGKDASFQFGIEDSDSIELWSEHYTFIEDWSYIDEIKPHAKDSLRKIQWSVYYQIK